MDCGLFIGLMVVKAFSEITKTVSQPAIQRNISPMENYGRKAHLFWLIYVRCELNYYPKTGSKRPEWFQYHLGTIRGCGWRRHRGIYIWFDLELV